MKKIIIKTQDDKTIEIEKEYLWEEDIYKELNDIRTPFIKIENTILEKKYIKSITTKDKEVKKDE